MIAARPRSTATASVGARSRRERASGPPHEDQRPVAEPHREHPALDDDGPHSRDLSALGDPASQGQYPLYNKVAGVVVTGNEDGAHACAEATLFNLTHLGCTVPPNADTYWVGEAGPGPSYLEAGGAALHVPGAGEGGDLRAGGGRRHGVRWSPRSSRWMLGTGYVRPSSP